MLAVVGRFLNVASVILAGRGQQDISDLFKTASILIHEKGDADGQLAEITADIEEMVKYNQNPTDAQIAAVRERRDALSEDIQSVDLTEDEPDPVPDPTPDPVTDGEDPVAFDPDDNDGPFTDGDEQIP